MAQSVSSARSVWRDENRRIADAQGRMSCVDGSCFASLNSVIAGAVSSYGMCRSYREAPADWDVFFRDHEAAAYIEGSSNPERPLCHGLMN